MAKNRSGLIPMADGSTTGGLPTVVTNSSGYTPSPADIPDPTLNPYYGLDSIALGSYTSPYADLLEQANQIMQDYTTPFTWDSDTDEMYQQYLGVMKQMGKSAFNNALGSLSSATGGRPNTWASSVASQAQQKYAQQASMAMPQFFQMALQAHQQQNQQRLQYANYILSLDETAYTRWKDQQTMKWELELEKYRRTQDEINNRLNQINSALQETNTLGYVSNEASLVLGIKAGTPSWQAKNAADQRAYELKQWEEQKKFELEQMQKEHAFQIKLEGIRHANDVALKNMDIEKAKEKKLSDADKAKYDKYTGAFGTMMQNYYNALTKDKLNDREIQKERESMYRKMDNYLNRVLNDNTMTEDAKNAIFESVQLDDFFMNYYEPRKREEMAKANAGTNPMTGMPSSYNR